MARFRLTGLDGRNPLHFLAALGLLRLGDRIRPGMRLGWSFEGAVRNPVLEPVADFADLERLAESMAAWLRELGKVIGSDSGVDRELGEIKKRVKGIERELKQARRSLKSAKIPAEAKENLRLETVAPLELALEQAKESQSELQRRKALAMGAGIAHLGDRIGVRKEIFRVLAEGALLGWAEAARMGQRDPRPVMDDPWLVVAELPALASEVLLDGSDLKQTPFSFGNGASGQELLKDFRNLTGDVAVGRLLATFLGEPVESRFKEEGTSLNWDPSDYRPHSQNARDPQKMPKRVDVGANLLAYLGLSFLTVVPVGPRRALTLGDRTVGTDRRNPGTALHWPLWDHLLPADMVALLFCHRLTTPSGRLTNGICEIWRAKVIMPDKKRPYFQPAVLLASA